MRITDFTLRKNKKKITMLTCYDYAAAKLIANTSADCLLVGDSVAMVVHGHPHTTFATLDMMRLHTEAVARGKGSQLLIVDLPFLMHRGSLDVTINAVKTLFTAGAEVIKIEGGDPHTCSVITHLVQAGIPVIGHIGLMPQFIHQLGGYRIQGKAQEQATLLLAQAKALEAAGCRALVLECIPEALAEAITKTLSIATVGIGAGPHTDGQVLVWHDLLGLHADITPKFIKQYANTKSHIEMAIEQFVEDVTTHRFPGPEHVY